MSEQEQTRPRPPWFDLAARVLRQAMVGDFDRAGAVIVRMQATHGRDSLIGAMNAWMDTAIQRSGGSVDRELTLVDAQTGQLLDAVSPAVDWAARLLQARRAMDQGAYDEVYSELNVDNLNAYLGALLQMCAGMVRYDQRTIARAAAARIPVAMVPKRR